MIKPNNSKELKEAFIKLIDEGVVEFLGVDKVHVVNAIDELIYTVDKGIELTACQKLVGTFFISCLEQQ